MLKRKDRQINVSVFWSVFEFHPPLYGARYNFPYLEYSQFQSHQYWIRIWTVSNSYPSTTVVGPSVLQFSIASSGPDSTKNLGTVVDKCGSDLFWDNLWSYWNKNILFCVLFCQLLCLLLCLRYCPLFVFYTARYSFCYFVFCYSTDILSRYRSSYGLTDLQRSSDGLFIEALRHLRTSQKELYPSQELEMMLLALSSSCEDCWAHHCLLLQGISRHPLLNTVPNIQILQLKSLEQYLFSCTSTFYPLTCT